MGIRDKLFVFRGEPIQIFAGDPMDIPCIETSDSEKLCKHPVVSVHMITYNHENYIRQAIEGVMMQKTDFEFELVIGEDCSMDKTREICFEYQKKYPDKIRVLWWHENLYRNPHPAGENFRRTLGHCRGEFIAFCEGDDYWTDPNKLQLQVDAMRKNSSVGICFCRAMMTKVNSDELQEEWDFSAFSAGFIKGMDFFRLHMIGRENSRWPRGETFIMTQTVMVKKSVLDKACIKFEVMNWRLSIGDTPTWLGVSALSDAYFLDKKVAVYRRMRSGALMANGYKTNFDATLARMFYAMKVWGLSFKQAVKLFNDLILIDYANYQKRLTSRVQMQIAWSLLKGDSPLRQVLIRPLGLMFWVLMAIGSLRRITAAIPIRIVFSFHQSPYLFLLNTTSVLGLCEN